MMSINTGLFSLYRKYSFKIYIRSTIWVLIWLLLIVYQRFLCCCYCYFFFVLLNCTHWITIRYKNGEPSRIEISPSSFAPLNPMNSLWHFFLLLYNESYREKRFKMSPRDPLSHHHHFIFSLSRLSSIPCNSIDKNGWKLSWGSSVSNFRFFSFLCISS